MSLTPWSLSTSLVNMLTISEREVVMPTRAEVLQRAAGIIERDGWTRHTYLDELGRVCLSGAIAKATVELNENTKLAFDYGGRTLKIDVAFIAHMQSGQEFDELLWDVIEEQHPEDWERFYASGASVAAWNDLPGRTKEEVVALLEKAAVRAAEAV